MRCITSPTSRPHRCCRRSQRIKSLVYTNLTQCNEHYQWRHWSIATGYDLLLSRHLQASHCPRCRPPPSDSDSLDLANHRPPIPRQTVDKSLRCLCTQLIIVRQLIVVLGPNFRVSYTPAGHPDHRVVTTLQDCISLLVIIRGFSPVNVPLDVTLSILQHDCLLVGFRLAL
jgi:hypothetical protein